jgi:uncharacterized protein YjbI with pentapeptide repeats
MNLDESLALHARGREEWNRWAVATRERRDALVAAEQWAWAYDSRADVYPTNEATQKWWSEAAAQFSYHEFVEPVDFSGFVFPSSGLFIMAKFPLGARFSGAQFLDGACFNYAQFGAAAEFDSAEFRSEAGFSHAEFLAEARFDGCRFSPAEGQPAGDGSRDLSSAKFARACSFVDVRCTGRVVVSETEFSGSANFDGASVERMFFLWATQFRGEASFSGACFPADTNWSDATFAVPPRLPRHTR